MICSLAELLIVVAIIAVLVAISIPIFTAQLEKAREATDAANIRAAYAEVTTALLNGEEADTGNVTVTAVTGKTGEYKYTATVKAQQKQTGWQGTDYNSGDNTIGGQHVSCAALNGWTISVSTGDTAIAIDETT